MLPKFFNGKNLFVLPLSNKAPTNALLIADNVAAMREAFRQSGNIDISSICAIHDVLMRGSGDIEVYRFLGHRALLHQF